MERPARNAITVWLSSPGPNVIFTDPVDAVAAEVERMEANGINKIIVLSHSGMPVDMRVAQEVEAAGGRALPCIVNVRFEQLLEQAVKLARRAGELDNQIQKRRKK